MNAFILEVQGFLNHFSLYFLLFLPDNSPVYQALYL